MSGDGERRRRRRERPAGLAWAAAAVVALVLGACGSDGDDSGNAPRDAQPSPGLPTFTGGSFDELPRFRSGEEVGPVSERDGVTTQSYVADNTRPEQVLDFYRDALEGWTELGAVEEMGSGALRQSWQLGEAVLQVSAAPINGAQGIEQDLPQVQYSLLLSEEGVPALDG